VSIDEAYVVALARERSKSEHEAIRAMLERIAVALEHIAASLDRWIDGTPFS
jgi:hypothetical protein